MGTESKQKGKGQLTVLEGAAMIAGTGIGSGVMALPFLIKSAGAVYGIIAFAVAFTISLLLHFLVADMILQAKQWHPFQTW